jgi:hypothetical protein
MSDYAQISVYAAQLMAAEASDDMRDKTLDECAALAREAAAIPYTDAKAVFASLSLADKFIALKSKEWSHV